MERAIILAGLALCLFALWALVRKDAARWFALSREVRATVVGHQEGWSDGHRTYAARLRFEAEGTSHEVIDQVLNGRPTPPEGTVVMLRFPVGRPDLARIPRPWTWAWVYLTIIGMTGILVARLMGWIGG